MTLTYNLDVRTAGVEEVAGHLVYYSLTGATNSWTQITDISAQASDNVVGVYTKSTIVNFSSPWAANSTIYFLWADDNSGGTDAILTIDNVKWSLPAPPTIISCTNLTNQTVLQCRSSTTMSVVAAGGNYQWTRNGVDIPGATASSYTIANMQAADAGTYTVRVFNGLGSTSCPPVTVTYMADIVPPTILYALGSTNPIEITLLFSEPIDTNDLANIPFNFSLYDTVSLVPLGITNALAPNRTTLILQTEPRLPDTKYTLEMNSVVDACAGNAMANPTVVAVHSICTSLLPLTAVWRYDDVTDTNAIAANWAQPGYDDSVAPWKSGPVPLTPNAVPLAPPGRTAVTWRCSVWAMSAPA